MKLPVHLLEKKEKAEYYLALVLRNEKATSVIFEKEGQTIRYISSDEEYFKNTIEDAETEEFLDVLDKVITTAETALPEEIETHKTLFGLKDSWIADDKIKKEYLDKLKKASDELALEPIGFLAFSESVINLLTKEEGAPITAVLAEIGKKYITVSWIKAGKILETKSSEIHESPTFTTDTLLKHFQSPGNLPSKVILLDSDQEDLTQEFISHKWSQGLSFLHIPQIVSLPEDASVKAMLLGAATQMDSNLLYHYSKNLEDEVEKVDEEKTGFPSKPQAYEEPEEEIVPGTEELEHGKIGKEELEQFANPEAMGEFVGGEERSLEFFGFLEGEDIIGTQLPEAPKEEIPQEEIRAEIGELPTEIKEAQERKFPVPVNAAFVTEKIRQALPKVVSALKKVRFDKSLLAKAGGKNKLLLIVPALLILLVLGILYVYLFKTSAQVTVVVNAQSKQQQTPVTFSSTTDIGNNTLAYQAVNVSEQGSVTQNTTGKKDVGNKATGTVTVFNNSSSPVSFPQGATITSSDNLDFTLDSSVTVASASGDVFSGTTPGTSKVNVTASDIGQNYNLPSGTKFTIGTDPNVAAKNDNAFSGGTKQTITIVSSQDIDNLLTALPKNLEQKARSDLSQKTTSGNTIIPQFITETVTNKHYSKNEGDQASSVTLTGTVNFEAISYNNSDMQTLADKLFSSSGDFSAQNLNVTAKNIKSGTNNDITADLTIGADILPKVDIESLRKEVAGSSVLKATNILMNIPEAQSVNISFNPSIPLLPKNLPSNPNKIFIIVNSR